MLNSELHIKLARTLLLVVLLGLLYVTAVPFGLTSPKRYGDKWARTELTPFYPNPGARLTGSDTIANILLFLPVGFCLHGWLKLRRKTSSTGFLKPILLAMLISAGIEILQFFLKDRFSSINDVMFNVMGAAAGSALAHYYFEKILERGRRGWQALAERPGLLLLAALSLCYLIWMLLPLNFTIAPHNLMRKWVQWQYSIAHLPALLEQPYTLDLREYWLLVAVENSLYSMVLGGVYVLCARWYWPSSRRLFWLGAITLFACLPLMSILQFCVIGGSPDVLTLLSSALGLALGLLLMLRLTRERSPKGNLPLGYGYYTEAGLAIPYFLFFLLLVLRPDLPDFRVEVPVMANNGTSMSLLLDFLQRLSRSLQPEVLQQGGSAYLRLFVKLFVGSLFLALALKYLLQSRWLEKEVRERFYIIGGSLLFAVAAQAFRFWLWGANVSLIAVAAITLGTSLAVWFAGRWPQEIFSGIKSSRTSRTE